MVLFIINCSSGCDLWCCRRGSCTVELYCSGCVIRPEYIGCESSECLLHIFGWPIIALHFIDQAGIIGCVDIGYSTGGYDPMETGRINDMSGWQTCKVISGSGYNGYACIISC